MKINYKKAEGSIILICGFYGRIKGTKLKTFEGTFLLMYA
jgi:hypothetical protein